MTEFGSKISIVMPAYNAAEHIRSSVRSILAQNRGDFELIIVNDGSTDATSEILGDIAALDSRIIAFSNLKNYGLIRSLRAAIVIARGEFIARLDADDLASADRLEKQVAVLESDPSISLVAGRFCVLTNGRFHLVRAEPAPGDTDEFMLGMSLGNRIAHPSVVFRRSAYDRTEGYDPDYFGAEDFRLWCRLAETGGVRIVDDVVLAYRLHAGQITQVKKKEVNDSTERVMRTLAPWRDRLAVAPCRRALLTNREFSVILRNPVLLLREEYSMVFFLKEFAAHLFVLLANRSGVAHRYISKRFSV